MNTETVRERIIRLIAKMREVTVDRGATPAEAANFAAKAAEWIEKHQIDEAELRAREQDTLSPETEVCQNFLRTGKKVFNPGMTQVVNALALGMCCKCVLLRQTNEAVYGIVGDMIDADYVCQVATTLVPALQMSARLEGAEHGYEKAGLIRWTNQYLTGAGQEIRQRLDQDRKNRSATKEYQSRLLNRDVANGGTCTALAVITGETLAVAKREAVAEAFKELYPHTRKTQSRVEYNHTAHECGREAGKRIGLHVAIE